MAFSLCGECTQVLAIEQLSKNPDSIKLRGLQAFAHSDGRDKVTLQSHFMGGNRLVSNLNNQSAVLSESKASGENNGLVNTAIVVLLSPVLFLLYMCRK